MADDGKPCLDGDMHLCEVYFRADMICFLDTSRPETAVNLLFQCSERQNATMNTPKPEERLSVMGSGTFRAAHECGIELADCQDVLSFWGTKNPVIKT